MDLMTYFPRDWEDRRVRFSLREAPMGEKIALRGTIRSVDFAMTRSQLGIATVEMEDTSGKLNAVWFKKTNPRYDVFSSLRQASSSPDDSLFVFGAIEWGPGGRQLRVEDASVCENAEAPLQGDEQFHFERIVPAYTVPEGMNERFLRTLVGRVFAAAAANPESHSAMARVKRKRLDSDPTPGRSRPSIFRKRCLKKNGPGNSWPSKNFWLWKRRSHASDRM